MDVFSAVKLKLMLATNYTDISMCNLNICMWKTGHITKPFEMFKSYDGPKTVTIFRWVGHPWCRPPPHTLFIHRNWIALWFLWVKPKSHFCIFDRIVLIDINKLCWWISIALQYLPGDCTHQFIVHILNIDFGRQLNDDGLQVQAVYLLSLPQTDNSSQMPATAVQYLWNQKCLHY